MELNTMEDETMGMKKVQNCRCLELEERVLKSEAKCIELETEFQKRNEEIESLELRFKGLESEKLVVEEELRNLKESEEGSLIDQIMVNKALEFEKQVAENEAEDWKRKFEKLVETVRKLDETGGFRYGELELDENVKLGLELARIKNIQSCKDDLSREGLGYHQSSGSPYMATPVKESILGTSRDNMSSSRRRVNKMLLFEDDGHKSTDVEKRSEKESADAVDTLEERSVSENYEDEDVEACDVNESTPLSSRKRKRVIASDNEDEDEEACEVNKNTPLSGRKRIQVIVSDSENEDDEDEDEDVEGFEVNKNTPRSGRKRIQIVVSDSENDDDEDNVPISILKNLKPSNKEMSDLADTPNKGDSVSGRSRTHRRVSSILNKQSVSKEMSASTERLVGIPTTDDADDDETEEEPESESESLNGFIVKDDSHETVSEKSDETWEEESDGGYAEAMSRLRRDKKPENRKWEYEADMLADFGQDPELCMKAVCVLYRFQTDDEKVTRSSHICNGRGFNKFDAERGTRIGRFLTDGDPTGDLKKSVEELKSFEFEAVETCGDLARKYSKQLFQIYNNREDPFFTLPPSP